MFSVHFGEIAMATPLEKARKDPGSMKAKILKAARSAFGDHGFHGTTTRAIAKKAGIDISTLYYHWGEKGDLYEAVLHDIYEDMSQLMIRVEKVIHGHPLANRIEIAIDMLVDFYFSAPEVSKLALLGYFRNTRHSINISPMIIELFSGIAQSMELCEDHKNVPTDVLMKILVQHNAIHNFISGEEVFRSMLKLTRKEYIEQVKDTLKFVLIPAFAGHQSKNSTD